MRKKSISIIIIISMLMTLCSCTNSSLHYYEPIPYVDEKSTSCDNQTYYTPKGRELTSKEEQVFMEIYEELSTNYNIKKAPPTVRIISIEELLAYSGNSSIVAYGFYVYEEQTLFVVDGAFEYYKSVVAHELIHHLAKTSALEYEQDGLIYGKMFAEGVTNFLSTKYFPHDANSSVYEFETQVAKLFSIAYGEHQLAQDYFSSNVDALRDDFNNALEGIYFEDNMNLGYLDTSRTVSMTPFDIMVSCVNSYYLFLSCIESANDQYVSLAMRQADCVIEMLLHYGEAKGVRAEMEKSLAAFIENESVIPWSNLSNIDKMI